MSTVDDLKVRMLIRRGRNHPVLKKNASISSGDIRATISESLSKENALRQFTRKSIGGTVKRDQAQDFNTLLSCLRASTSAYVRIVTLETDKGKIALVSDEACGHLIGAVEVDETPNSVPNKELPHEDREFYKSIGAEVGPGTCREKGCTRLTVAGSARCAQHLFQLVTGRTYERDTLSH